MPWAEINYATKMTLNMTSRSIISCFLLVCILRSYSAEPTYTPFNIPLGVDYTSDHVQKIISDKGFVAEKQPWVWDAKRLDAIKADVLSGKFSAHDLSNIRNYTRNGKMTISLQFNPHNNEIASVGVRGSLVTLSDTTPGQLKILCDVVGKITSDKFENLFAKIGEDKISPEKILDKILSGAIAGESIILTNDTNFGAPSVRVKINRTIYLSSSYAKNENAPVYMEMYSSNVENLTASGKAIKELLLQYESEIKKASEEELKKKVLDGKNDSGL